ncbi:hypothetical protein CSA57_00660 [candidate division KSB3 bacterium]|nr:MAG: hypothetical protein CSA57_00660 [candidate division KSB3 bacterium]
MPEPIQIVEKFWQEAKPNIYSLEREKAFFTEKNYQILKKKAEQTKNIYELTPVINTFLKRLQISHTQFYDNHAIDFYMFRSMFCTRDITRPKVNHIGSQYTIIDNRFVVREVLEGYPAAIAGIRRGDVVLEADGTPFHPYHSFNPDGKNIGYIHLWSGTHKNILRMFSKIIIEELHDKDGMILDLRGGCGGAWYEYLDPFFPDRKDFFEYTWIDRLGKAVRHQPECKSNPVYFSGPMVVLINEGVRSGKEALAYQFKKSDRATLIGTTTKGAFSVGRGIFNTETQPYFLYLATAELPLDGKQIEGRGISPTLQIPYPLNKSLVNDPQLEAALLEIAKKCTSNVDQQPMIYTPGSPGAAHRHKNG